MKRCFIEHFLTKAASVIAAAVVALLVHAPAHASTFWMRGANWPDSRDNFQDGVIYPDGITSSTTTTQAASEADLVALSATSIGVNFVRIGINAATISDNWPAVQAYINELNSDGIYVDLGFWSGSDHAGTIENVSAWQTAWETVDGVYKNNNAVYYEPFNEPFGYSSESQLAADVYEPFLDFIKKSQNHIILDGTGYANDVTAVGADPNLTGCLLGLHMYSSWWGKYTTEPGWEGALATHIGAYANRTVITECGSQTTVGGDYDVSTPGNFNICFVRGLCEYCSAQGVGFIYWPLVPTGLFSTPGGAVINQSLINELQNGWDFYTTAPYWGICDFNVIGQTDYSVYRPSTGWWYFQAGGSVQWGTNIDIAVPADYAGNGLAQEAVWRTSNSTWYIDGGAILQYGTIGDIPVPGDYLGNGSAQIAVWRPSAGTWYVNGLISGVHWGTNGDIPVPGYYNNDGHLDYAVWRPSNGTWYVKGGVNQQWGQMGDIPVPGDYVGSGITQFAVFRPSNGTWYINGVANVQWGTNGDIPVPGDYTGGGETGMAVWRSTNSTWHVYRVGTTTYGATNDVPLPLPYAIRHYSLGYTN